MKGTFYSCMCIVAIWATSCGEKATVKEGSKETTTYQLTAMHSGQLASSTDSALEWEEAYMLNSDFSFEKVRVRDGETLSASGNYERKKLSDGEYFIFKYDTAHPIIGNCTADYNETLRIVSATELRGTWMQCDGPALTYQLKE